MSLLRIDSTIQGPSSASTQLAELVVAEVTAARPDLEVVHRHLGTDPLPSTAWADAVSGSYAPEEQRTDAQRSAITLAASLAEEVQAADLAVFALPLYNFGVSQHVKTWIDLLLAGAPLGTRLLDGTPTVLITTRGGAYGPGTPREGWDHNVGYLVQMLEKVWGADLTVVEREFTLVGVNPALDEFTDLAAELKVAAEAASVDAGRSLAAAPVGAGVS